MRKWIAAMLLIAAALLAGCSAESVTPETPESEQTVVGIIQVGAESDWRVANTESMRSSFSERNGYRMLFEDARQKQENQIMALRKFIQQKVDYIILMPIEEYGWTSVLEDAKLAGIPVILVDRMVDVSDDSLYTAHVGSDFLAQGRMAVDWIRQTFLGARQVNIVHIQGTLGATAQIGRTAALENAVSTYSSWNMLAQLEGDYTQPKAYAEMKHYLETMEPGTRIDVVYCENDNEAFGAIEALEEMGYECGKDVKVISFDATRGCLQLCMEGKISLAVECNPLLGPMASNIIRQLEKGEQPDKQNYVKESCYTPDDLTQAFIDSREY